MIPVTGFYSVFGKAYQTSDKATGLSSTFGRMFEGLNKIGFVPEVITNDKQGFLLSKKKQLVALSIFACVFYFWNFILAVKISRLSRIVKMKEKVAIAVNDLRCIICESKLACKLFSPCMHLCVCDTCRYNNCPMCSKPINGVSIIKY